MAKYIAAIVQERNGTCTVLKCDGQNNSDPKNGPIQRYGRIVGREQARHYGDALDKANTIEKKG